MKKLSSLLVCLLIVSVLSPMALARMEPSNPMDIPAQQLYKVGLFKGTGVREDGTPEFALHRAATRSQAAIMFVRLLGKEAEALEENLDSPFTDLSPVAAPYVGYLYHNGLAHGVTENLYGSQQYITSNQYLTFVLRALGYRDPDDFTVATAVDLGKSLGLLDLCRSGYSEDGSWRRAGMACASFNALFTKIKGTNTLLCDAVGVDMFSYNDFKNLVTVKGPTVENDRGDINKTYTVKVNMSYEDWRDTDVDLLYWYMQRLCKEYNPCEEDTYLIFNYDVRGESGGYVFGYPDGGTSASVD